MTVPSRASRGVLTAALAVTLLAGCGDDTDQGSDDAPADRTPTSTESGPAESNPTPPVNPIEAVRSCLVEIGRDVAPEEPPRFGAIAEYQIPITFEGGVKNVGVFVYDHPEAAAAGESELAEAGSSSTEVIFHVVLTGSLVDNGAEFAAAVEEIRACADPT